MRDANGSWRPDGFKNMLASMDADGLVMKGFELGNEPDLFSRHNVSKAPTPQQLALDFGVLSSLVKSQSPSTLILGPDVSLKDWKSGPRTRNSQNESFARSPSLPTRVGQVADSVEFFENFLDNLTDASILDVATWHFYYGPGSSRPHGLNWTSFSAPNTL